MFSSVCRRTSIAELIAAAEEVSRACISCWSTATTPTDRGDRCRALGMPQGTFRLTSRTPWCRGAHGRSVRHALEVAGAADAAALSAAVNAVY